eukprot:TRINITY_DN135101_c2_g1_i1.p1 TRINITY_DN135101_c2_g1~~TRINITY_DN135101_c2_g1_i1.p1  ORF type:complete len:868 (+),score=80.71 TRINITY_DN135101_c2_g1_i1:151-2604(+)
MSSIEESKADPKNSEKLDHAEEKGGLLWNQLRKFVNLVDELRDLGLQEHINLPRIAVLGTQSSGKSSVLESIVGLDFLPRGEGIVTRRPLELRLHHLQDDVQPWATFEEVKYKTFTDFTEVRRTIEYLTDKYAGDKKNIVDIPIVLTIHSYNCPDLTLIDLPGITRIPLQGSEQPPDIERITTEMAKRYCGDERTIILCVIPANIDLSTSEALKYAQEWDVHQVRTLGVLTKLDIMDVGSNAKKALMNQVIHLKLGYVGVKNRSQQNIIDKLSVQRGLDIEKEWFINHPIYRSLPKDCYGTDTLTHKLSRILYAHIRNSLPDIVKEVDEKLKVVDERLKDLGNPLPSTAPERMQMLWTMISNFVNMFRNRISGKVDLKAVQREKQKPFELTGGAKIKTVFYDLYKEVAAPEYRVTENLSDKDIERAIILHEGDNLSGFPSVEVFYYLVQSELEKLKEPALKCLTDVYYYLEELALTIIEKVFIRFPGMTGELMAAVRQIMSEERDKTKYIVESLIESEIGYMFTNDIDYNGKRTDIVPRVEGQDNKILDPTKIYVKELRTRIEAYYKLVIRNIRDSIPKTIGCFLVKAIEDKLQLELATKLTNNEEVNVLLSEPPSIAEERKRLIETKNVLKKALKAMQRDPDLNISYSPTEDELLQDLNRLKQETKKKVAEKQEKAEKAMNSIFGASTAAITNKDKKGSSLFGGNQQLILCLFCITTRDPTKQYQLSLKDENIDGAQMEIRNHSRCFRNSRILIQSQRTPTTTYCWFTHQFTCQQSTSSTQRSPKSRNGSRCQKGQRVQDAYNMDQAKNKGKYRFC